MSDLPPSWEKTLPEAKHKMSGQEVPSVGRVVHFVASGTTECIAAMITKVHSEPQEGPPVGRCELIVFSSDRPLPMFRNADFVPTEAVDSWHWPERVG